MKELVSHRDPEASERPLPGIESGRDEHEGAALGRFGEGKSKYARRQVVDVDVRLRVRPRAVSERQPEPVALVIEEGRVGGRANLLYVVGKAGAVIVVERRRGGPGRDVVHDGTNADVRRRLRPGVRVLATGSRPGDLRRVRRQGGMCSQRERESSGDREDE